MRVRSHAKVNLDLRVLGRRADGFHELRTVFHTISLADTLGIAFQRSRTATRVTVQSDVDIPGENLITRSADAVLSALGIRANVEVNLNKRIPMGGGLGGGSSNAAAMLQALPALAGKLLPPERLLEIAAALGSDVPFFLEGGAAVALGRGTELYPLPEMRPWPLLLVAPALHVSTAEAYTALGRGLTSDCNTCDIMSFQSCVRALSEPPGKYGWPCVNEFEPAVFSRYPLLKSIKEALLRAGARPALMSGSGSTIFGIFPDRAARDRAWRRMGVPESAGKVFRASLVTRRAYQRQWARQLDRQ